MEEKDGIVQAGSCLCSFPQHTTIGYVEKYGRPTGASSAGSNHSVNSYYQSQPLNTTDQFRSYSPLAFQNNEEEVIMTLGVHASKCKSLAQCLFPFPSFVKAC